MIKEINGIATQHFLSGGGKAGELLRTMDWSKNSLGDPSEWPQSLRTSVSICLNSSFPLIIWWGKDLVKIYNDAWHKLIAAKHLKAMGSIGAAIWPQVWHIAGPMLHGVLDTGEATLSEDQLLVIERNGNPEECYFTFSYSAIRDESDGIGGVFCTVNETTKRVTNETNLQKKLVEPKHEITGQVLARQKIEESQAFNRTILESSPDCLKIIDADGRLLFMNHNGLCTMEIDDFSQFIDQPWWNLWEEENRQLVKDAVAKALTGETAFFQALGPTAKGRHKWWDVIVSPVLEEGDKKVSHIIAVSRDITKQKHEAIKLEESNKRYNTMLMQSPFAFSIMKGKDQVVTVANNLMKEFWGKGQDVEGKNLLQILPELKDQPFPGMIDSVYTTGTPVYANEMLARLNHNDKLEDRYFNIVYQPYLEADETISGVITIAHEVTNQVVARRKIEESEQRFRLLITQAPVAICILKGKDYIVEVANDFYLQLVEKEYEFVGKPIFNSLPELKTQGIKELLDNVLQTGLPFYGNEMEVHMLRNKKREQGFFNFVYQAFKETDGTITGIIVVVTEVTEQVLSRKKMEVQTALFADMLMTAPGFVCTMSGPEHVYELVNEQYQSLFGKRQIQGKPIMVALPELEGQGFDKLLDNVYNTGVPYVGIDIPITLARDENLTPELRYFNFSYQPMYDENKNIYSILVFGYEVTDQMNAKKRIEESEIHFRLMADLMPAKITNATADGGVIYYNKNWLDFAGMSFEELKDFGYHKIMHPEEIEEFTKRFQISAQTRTNLEMEMRFMNKAGEYIWHLNRASPVKDENGDIVMWVGVTSEIQKIKDEEYRKDNFIKMVSHELKTPVTSIKGYVQILLMMLEGNVETTDFPQIKTSLVRVDKLVSRLTRLIIEMLDLTRIEESKLTLQKKLFSLNELVNETVEDIRYTNTKHTINIHHDFTCDIIGDRDRIEQVIINFIGNAIKYSPDDNAIDVRIFEAGKNEVSVCIKDHGIGIDKKEFQKIFERFYRVEGKIEETFSGFGIGLFISKAIIESHNGSITMDSEKGKGSAFTFTIPCGN